MPVSHSSAFESNQHKAYNHNFFKRLFLATLVAYHDGSSWIDHSKGNLDRFVYNRRIVDSIPFGLGTDEGYLVARYLGHASHLHNEAEQNIPRDQVYSDKLLVGWEDVENALRVRYLLLNGFRYKQISLGDQLTILMSRPETSSLGENIVLLEQMINNPQISIRSHNLAVFETELWVAHHVRDYNAFIERAIKIFMILGHDNRTASNAAERWVFSCKQHDAAESCGNKLQSLFHWAGAGVGLIPFYYTLIGGSARRV